MTLRRFALACTAVAAAALTANAARAAGQANGEIAPGSS